MLSRLSLRTRIFLIFAGLAAGLVVVQAAALFIVWRRLNQAGVNFLGEAAPHKK